jgi:hypothetical protein
MSKIEEYLGKDADFLLNHKCTTISKELLHLPGLILLTGFCFIRIGQ